MLEILNHNIPLHSMVLSLCYLLTMMMIELRKRMKWMMNISLEDDEWTLLQLGCVAMMNIESMIPMVMVIDDLGMMLTDAFDALAER
jgi:hypothetical protein